MYIALNLIALALGYLVFLEATKEKKDTKTVGRLIGVFIMTAALGTILIAFAESSATNCIKKGGFNCPILSKHCLLKGKS